MRYTVLETGEASGHAELPEPEDGLAVADLEPLPVFERVRPVLEGAARALGLMSERVEAARRAGRLPPEPPPPGPPGQSSVVIRGVSDAELAVWGDDVRAAWEARARLVFSLADPAGRPVPAEDVRVEARTFPGHPYPPQPPLVVVMFRWPDSGETEA